MIETYCRTARIPVGLLFFFSCALLFRTTATAQKPDEGFEKAAPQTGLVNAGDVYINDSFEAADALSKARALTDQKRWREAAEILQKASDALADHVVGTPDGYVSLRSHVTQIICNWPEEGLRAYQGLYDATLQREIVALGDSPDVDAAVKLFDQYFCTTGAAAMADRIAQVAIESGDLSLAQWALRRVLTQHPAAKSYTARYQSVIALTAAMMGDQTPQDSQLAEIRMRWKGRQATLTEVLAEVANEFRLLENVLTSGDWPMFAGNLHRNGDSTTNVDEPGLLWRYVHRPSPEKTGAEGIIDGLARVGGDAPRGPAVFPVVAGDLVYIQSHRNIAAVHKNSGAVAWEFRSEEPEAESSPYADNKTFGGDTPVVGQGRLFAALPTTDSTYYDYETARTVPELLALDALTGAVLWRVVQKGIDAQGTATAYDSAPMARNGRVYIVSRRRRSFGFEDCYLDAYRAADGKLLFRTHLASASTSSFGARGASQSVAALQGDMVYVGTNLGAIVAVGAYTGGARWIHLYDRVRSDGTGSPAWPAREAVSLSSNPVVWTDNKVVISPADSARLMILNDADGKAIHSIPLQNVSNMHSLYGARGNLLCGAGEDVFCYDLNKQAHVWSARFADESAVAGRGMWAGNELIIPRRDGLSRVRIEDGKTQLIPMDSHYSGGSVLALPEQILIGGSKEMLCYVRKVEIWKSIKARMAASPNDPLPALEFAEVALGAGEVADAMQAMQEAVGRVKPALTTAPAAVRTRVFSDALKLLGAMPTRPDAADIDTLLLYAGESATNLASQVEYRFRFAEFFESAGQPHRAIRLYQQILRDRSLRDWPPTRTGASVSRSHVRATAKIAELIRRFGAEVYAEHESEAQQWLEGARSTREESKLEQLIESFPNSSAASEAMMLHADLLGSAGRHEASAHSWERAYKHHSHPAQRQEILLKIAQSYELASKPELAYLWIAKGARESPSASFDLEGRTTTFAAYRDRLSAARARIEPSLPDISLPLKATYQLDLVGTVRLLTPRFSDVPELSWNYLYVSNPDGIRGYQADTGKDLWPQPSPVRMEAELLTARSDIAVFATPFEVFGLEVSTGLRRYAHGEYPARLLDPGADWEDGSNFRTHALHGDRLVSVREDGAATCMNILTGEIVWSAPRRAAPIGPLHLNESVLVYHTAREGRGVVQIASAVTGELIDSIVTDEQRPIEDLYVTLEGYIVVVTSKSLACYDASGQERRWHVALNWPVRRATLQFAFDSLYFIDDAGVLKKISLEDGTAAWESQRLLARGETNETLQRMGEYLFVTTSSSVSTVDVGNGLLLWQGMTPESPRFVERHITSSYIAALNAPGEAADGIGQIYFYDHRNASGVIPRVGGVLDLGVVRDVRGMLALDGAMVVQTGSTIRGFAGTK